MAQVESKNRATSSEEARREVLGRVGDEGVEFVLLWFTDIEGHLKSFAITPAELEDALDDGMGFDGSSITEFQRDRGAGHGRHPRSRLVPADAVAGGRDEGRADDLRHRHARRPYEGDPRYVLRRALERMKKLGFDTFNVGPELEYFIFKDDRGTETSTRAATSP